MLIAGQNGSGKSVLATSLARGVRRVVNIDPKGDAPIPNAYRTSSSADAAAHVRAGGRVDFVPSIDEWATSDSARAAVDRILAAVFAARGYYLVIVHELADVSDGSSIPRYLSAALRKGRSLKISLVLVTQRPRGVPRYAVSEARHLACFVLVDPDDRKRMGELMGDGVKSTALPRDFRYWYRGPDLTLHLQPPIRVL